MGTLLVNGLGLASDSEAYGVSVLPMEPMDEGLPEEEVEPPLLEAIEEETAASYYDSQYLSCVRSRGQTKDTRPCRS